MPAEPLSFTQFRKFASEIAGLRTVPRLTSAAVAPGMARVRIVAPHSLGYRDNRWIYAPGFADGEFPARSAPNPLLPDETVNAINARIKPRRLFTARDRNRKEPLYLFMILDSATRRATLTYPGSTLEGETKYPSVYVREIARHFQDDPIIRPSPAAPSTNGATLSARGEGEWLAAVADEWTKGSLTDERAVQLLGTDIVDRVKLEREGICASPAGQRIFAAGRRLESERAEFAEHVPICLSGQASIEIEALRRCRISKFQFPKSAFSRTTYSETSTVSRFQIRSKQPGRV